MALTLLQLGPLVDALGATSQAQAAQIAELQARATSAESRVRQLERAPAPAAADSIVSRAELASALADLATRYGTEMAAAMGEGTIVGPRMQSALVARAKREVLADLKAALGL